MKCSELCPREREDCEPWANIVADDGSTFICCGESDPGTRSVIWDKFRLCFLSVSTVSCYDYDRTDLLDLVAVISDALAWEKRSGSVL